MSKRNVFNGAQTSTPPIVKKQPVTITQHGQTRTDDYAWLRDDKWQEVLRNPEILKPEIRAMIEAENKYYESVTSDVAGLRQSLLKEMRARIKEDDESVPVKDGDWEYWSRFRDGGEYPVFVRRKISGSGEQTILDGDKESKGANFYRIGSIAHSPDQKLAAIGVDRLGSEYYTITVRNIETGEDYSDKIENADGGGAVWAADSQSFYYVERDDSQRPKRVKLHRLGADPADDPIIYEEPDDGFFLDISKSQSGEFIFIYSGNHATSEVRFVRADATGATPTLIQPREQDIEYTAEHHGDDFYITTNADDAVDFKIVKVPVTTPGRKYWKDWIPHQAGVNILTFVPYKEYNVRLVRNDALPTIVVSTYDGNAHEISFDEAAFDLDIRAGFEYDTKTVRFIYESPSTPKQTFDYDMAVRSRTLLKTQEVPSGHDASLYVIERLDVPGEGGAKIPVITLRLKSTPKDGSAPVLLYGYGAYGITIPDSFSTNILPMVDRGVIYALAHVRGGAAKGQQWYLDGKRASKMNSFTDFIDAGEALIKNGYTSKQKIVIYGGSAGGLLVGAAVNLRPDLFAGVIAAVPFVDVINTISDESLPLTPPEWDEWGNPIEDEEAFKNILSYSPYDNIKREDYPPVMMTGGLTDYRVTYWEPAKWVARLRDDAKGGPFTLRMNMGAGHAGSAARFEQLDERAHLYAFALKVMGKENTKPVSHKK